MTVAQAITKAYYEATGKTNLTTASPKYAGFMISADNNSQTWQNEAAIEWDSRYGRLIVGNVTATDTYDLDDSFRGVNKQEGNPLKLYSPAGGSEYYYKYVPPDRLQYYGGTVNYRNKANVFTILGGQLKFAAPFRSTDPGFGYVIDLPAYVSIDPIVSDAQTVQVDDPMWLVYMMAATYTRNKLALSYRTPALEKLAKMRMDSMILQQSSQLDEVVTVGTDMFFDPSSYGSSGQEAWL